MPIRITGLNSGLDTEALVSELVSAYRKKTEKYTKAQTKLSWKQDAWKNLNDKVSKFYSKLTNMKYSTAYVSKKASISDATKASVSVKSSVATGSYSLKINETAKSGYLSGAALGDGITANSTMAELGYFEGGEISVTAEGKTTNIAVDSSTKISDFISSLNEAGVNASFDAKYHRIYVSAKKAGAENDFTLSGISVSGNEALSKLGLNVDSSEDREPYKVWAAYAKNADGNPYITGYDDDGKPITNGDLDTYQTKLALQDIINQKGQKSAEITKNQAKIQYAQAYRTVQETADTTSQEYQDALAIVNGSALDAADKTAIQDSYAAGNLDSDITGWRDSIADARKFLKEHEVVDNTTLDLDAMEDKIIGAVNVLNSPVSKSEGAVRMYGQDAEIELNGVTYQSSSNEFDINGLTINALAKTTDEITISVDTNSQALYDTVKDFIKEYNTLINEMNSLYNADSAKGYEPLTSEEKDAMSDREVEEWEKKIKDSLFRRDDTVSSIVNSLHNIMLGSFTVNGKSYSLSSFGISTIGILNANKNEEKAFHIDGDSEDSAVSGKDDRLMAAIKEDPDVIVDFMKQLTGKLYDSIHERMSSSTLSSFGVVYNDKQMAAEYSDYTTTISKWDKKLESIEESYFKKFAAMESALATLQSQQSSLASLMGF